MVSLASIFTNEVGSVKVPMLRTEKSIMYSYVKAILYDM